MIRDLQGRPLDAPKPFWTRALIQVQKWLEPAKASKVFTQHCARFHEPDSRKWIPSFVQQYGIRKEEIARCTRCTSEDECWNQFSSLNDFFARVRTNLPKVVSVARRVIASPADAYTLYQTAQQVNDKVWIKGTRMSLDELFASRRPSAADVQYHMFIFRLAPHHYHRFHVPCSGWVVALKRVGTEYFSVDPVVVRSRVNVYARNVRVIVQLETFTGSTLFLAIIGATCVGSIVLSHPKLLRQYQRETQQSSLTDQTLSAQAHVFRKKVPIRLYEELGYFQYGGSTIVMCLPAEEFQLLATAEPIHVHSAHTTETEIQVGYPLLTFRQ
jgi:phosphatidylserine decarboxylase